MSDVKHTPGPWFVGGVRQKVDGQQALGIFRFDAELKRDENIASVWYDPRDGAGTLDARLIAAAPDLLEALIALRGACIGMVPECADQVDAAIAKATNPTS